MVFADSSFSQAVQSAIGITTNQQLYLPGLRGLWAMSNHDNADDIYDLSGQGRLLSNLIGNDPTFGEDNFMGYAESNGADELTGRLDEAGLDVSPVSMFILAYFDNAASAQETAGGKWYETGANERSYILYRTSGGLAVAGISGNGTDTYLATSTVTIGATTWCYLGLTYEASTKVDINLGVSGTWERVSNTTSIPASCNSGAGGLLFFANQTAPGGVSNRMDGRIAVVGLAEASWSENIHRNNWEQYRQLLRV